jgi:predicted metal-binding membrane protein
MAFRAIVLGAAMLPAAWPALRLYRGLGTPVELALFTAGYLAVWVVAAGLLMLLMVPAGPLLAVAGLYQLGPLQAVSLRRCRAPLGLLVRRSGLRAGVEYAIACAGCCAGLMLALVALDMMMSALWMTGLVVLVLAEKVLRHGVLVGRVAGVAILALAVVTLL